MVGLPCGARGAVVSSEEAAWTQPAAALGVIMKYDRNFLALDQWQERSYTADINSSDLCPGS